MKIPIYKALYYNKSCYYNASVIQLTVNTIWMFVLMLVIYLVILFRFYYLLLLLSAFICENVWWKYLSSVFVLYGSETWTLQKRGYSATWSIWNVDMEAYNESIVDWAQNKWRSIANGWHRKRNDGHSQKSTEEMVRSCPLADMTHYWG